MTPCCMKNRIRALSAAEFHDPQLLKRAKGTSQCNAIKHDHQKFPLLSHHGFWRTFKTQAAAFEYVDSQRGVPDLRVFAEEVSTAGQRLFITASASTFWQQYKQMKPAERHHYEIIREAQPCNLFFDLEFCPETNPCLDGPVLVQLLLNEVALQLQNLYDIPWDDSFALEFDSSTPHKFSRHLIVAIPGLAFADACHAGRFARMTLLRLLQKGSNTSRPGQLLVHNRDASGLTSFVDMGVYTRNRAFRLPLSSKYGKQAVLTLTHRFGGATRCPRMAFFDSLISVPQHCILLKQKQQSSSFQHQQQRHQLQWNMSAAQTVDKRQRPLVSLLYVDQPDWQAELHQLPVPWQQVAMLQLNPLPHHQYLQQQQQQVTAQSCSWSDKQQLPPLLSACPCQGPSAFPLLEQFITSVCVQGGVQGSIRSWVMQPGSGCICFNMKDNRYCANVGRQHRSNGVYYVADLAAGVYYQKCYDPECRGYRSSCMPLPADVWQLYMVQLQHPPGKTAAPVPAAPLLPSVVSAQVQLDEDSLTSDAAEDALCWQILEQVEQEQVKEKQYGFQTNSWQGVFDSSSSSKGDNRQQHCLQVK